jgi:hypothetical protein
MKKSSVKSDKTADPPTAKKKRGRPKGSKNTPKASITKPGSTRAKAATADQDLFASMQNFVNAAGSLEKAIEILSVFKR